MPRLILTLSLIGFVGLRWQPAFGGTYARLCTRQAGCDRAGQAHCAVSESRE